MGSNAIASMTIGIGMMLAAFYLSADSSRFVLNVLQKGGLTENPYVKQVLHYFNIDNAAPESNDVENKDSDSSRSSEILLTAEELRTFDGGPESKGLYLAILGEVFDVEKGAQHYRPGGGYAFFAGRDATRAYITGDFKEGGLTDDVTDMDASALAGLEDWLSFYAEEYSSIGKVVGRYFDSNGQPTKDLLMIREKMNSAKNNKWLEEKNKEVFPPCNSEWSKEKGSKVWCTKKSGGVDRSWVGVPRELHLEGKDPRCVCVRNFGAPSSSPDSKDHDDKGDLSYPGLKEYPGCPPNSETCSVSHP